MIPHSNIELGTIVIDKVSGFVGTAVHWTRTLAGNIRVGIEGKAGDNDTGHTLVVDIQQIEEYFDQNDALEPIEEEVTDHGFKIGDKIRCRLTEREGVAIAETHFMNGCVQYEINFKPGKDGKDYYIAPWQYFEIVKANALKLDKKAEPAKEKAHGGPSMRMPKPKPRTGRM